MHRNRLQRAAAALLALVWAGCTWPGPTFRADALGDGVAPGPTVVVAPWFCGGEPSAGSNQIIVETAVAGVAHDRLSTFAHGGVRVGAPPDACADMRPHRIRDGDRIVPAQWARDVTTAYAASSALVLAVDDVWKCTNEGETVGGTFIAFGISRCYEQRTTLSAAIVDPDGRVLWSAFRVATMGSPDERPPNGELGVVELLEDLPVATLVP